MKKAHSFCFVFLMALIAFCALNSAWAQTPVPVGGDAGKIVEIRKIYGQKVKTPEYQLVSNQTVAQKKDWYQISVTYNTSVPWIDEMDFTYYVLVKSREAGNKKTCFRGQVTYLNVAKGQHFSDMYLHPSTVLRYGEVEAVAVLINVRGKLEAISGLPITSQRWWEQFPPVDGYVLNRLETPFAMIAFDNYEAIKSRSGAR